MSNLGAALGGLSEGVGTALPEAFRDLNAHKEAMQKISIMNQENDRANQKFAIEKPGLEAESNMKQALSADTMQTLQAKQVEQKRRDTPVDLSQLPGDHAGINATIDYAKFTGRVKDGMPVTQGAIEDSFKDAHENPEKIAPFYQKAFDESSAKVAQMQAPIKASQDEITALTAQLNDPKTSVLDKAKIEKKIKEHTDSVAAAEKALQAAQKQKDETGQLLMEADKGAKVKQFIQDNKATINGLPQSVQDAVKMNLSQGADGIAGAVGVINKYAEESGKQQTLTPELLAASKLREQLGREPTATEIYNQLAQDKKAGEKPTDFSLFYDAQKKKGMSDDQISNAWAARQVKIAGARGEAYVGARMYSMIDTQTGQPKMVSGKVLNGDSSGRYAPTGVAEKAMTKTALIEDIRGNLSNTRQSLSNVEGFDEKSRLQIYKAMNSADPSSALSNLVSGKFGKSLTDNQQQYLVDMSLLTENAMAMRSVLGAGQGSDDMRKAIKATIPSAGTFSKSYANKQLNSFESVLNRLERGVPNVPIRPMQGSGGGKVLTFNPKTGKIE